MNLERLTEALERKLDQLATDIDNNQVNTSELNAYLSAAYKLNQIVNPQSVVASIGAPVSNPQRQELAPPKQEVANQPQLNIASNAGSSVARMMQERSRQAKVATQVSDFSSQSLGKDNPSSYQSMPDVWGDNPNGINSAQFVPSDQGVTTQSKPLPVNPVAQQLTRQDYQQPYPVPNSNPLTKDKRQQQLEEDAAKEAIAAQEKANQLLMEQLEAYRSMQQPQQPQQLQTIQEPIQRQHEQQPITPEVINELSMGNAIQSPMPVPLEYYQQQYIQQPMVQRVVIRGNTSFTPLEQMMHDILSAAGVPPGFI